MDFENCFPVWEKLTDAQKKRIKDNLYQRRVEKDAVLHHGSMDCTGLFLIRQGQLRAYILSDQGREITLYRLFDLDLCLFSASCIMRSIQFEIIIEAEKNTDLWIIPPEIYQDIMAQSAPLANFTNEVMAARFSKVMWLMEQILWKSFDSRLAQFLLEESSLEETNALKLTHEAIGNHLGNPREVVTRMLRYFQNENMVRLSRGIVEITDKEKLLSLIHAAERR